MRFHQRSIVDQCIEKLCQKRADIVQFSCYIVRYSVDKPRVNDDRVDDARSTGVELSPKSGIRIEESAMVVTYRERSPSVSLTRIMPVANNLFLSHP